jgi:hypothetical protein
VLSFGLMLRSPPKVGVSKHEAVPKFRDGARIVEVATLALRSDPAEPSESRVASRRARTGKRALSNHETALILRDARFRSLLRMRAADVARPALAPPQDEGGPRVFDNGDASRYRPQKPGAKQ